MKSRTSGLLALGGATAAFVYSAYRKDLNRAVERIETDRQFIETENGVIEFAESGNGPALLMIHGAGGGFDQGLDLGRQFAGENFRIIAPSRFGYLGTPVPADASPQAQADAYAQLLDALQIEKVPVIGVSAGGPSAMQFSLRHRDRCSALVLVVPLAYAPGVKTAGAPSPRLANAMLASDFLYWAGTKFAFSTMCNTVLGTPPEEYRKASDVERRRIATTLSHMLPISRRAAGLLNEAKVASKLDRYPLEKIRVPTLIVGAADCGYGTYPACRYLADEIPAARLFVFDKGGHVLAGHGDEMRSLVGDFLKEHPAPLKVAVNS